MMSMSQAVTEFQKSESFGKLAPSTRKRQMINLNRLLTELPGNKPVAQLRRVHIDGVIAQARRNGVTGSSLNAYRTDLRRFCKWLIIYGHYKAADPSTHLENERVSTPGYKRKPISGAQARLMIELADQRHPCDGMTVLLLLVTALRGNEVCNMRWRNLDSAKPEVFRDKIKDYHPIYTNQQLDERLAQWRAYIEERHGKINPDWYVVPARATRSDKPGYLRMNRDWPLVPTRRQSNTAKWIKPLLAGVGETDLRGRATHTLRRTAGNLFKDAGADMRQVKNLFGHASEKQSEQYLDQDAAKDEVRQAMQMFRI